MKDVLRFAVSEAKDRLKTDPFDAGHDYYHHLAVVTNCLDIVRDEKLALDIDALLIAAWWHDYKRNEPDENDRVVTETLEKAGATEEFIKKVIEIKNSHSFGEGQVSLEAQVLYDADKLEYASVARVKHVTEAVKKGEMTAEIQDKYKKAFLARIPTVLQELHFESTKPVLIERIKELKAYARTDPLWTEIAELMI